MNIRKFSPCILGVFLLTSCHIYRSSELQVAVSHARPGTVEKLHTLLSQRGVEHKIVQFRYDVAERPMVAPVSSRIFVLGETPLAFLPKRSARRERTGIIYKDDQHRGEPWWYVDAETSRAIWLPSGDVESQVSFAMHRRIEMLRVQEFDRAVTGMAKEAGITNAVIDWNARFRRAHGTDFDAASPLDVDKMRALKGL